MSVPSKTDGGDLADGTALPCDVDLVSGTENSPVLQLSGKWTFDTQRPSADAVRRELASCRGSGILRFETDNLLEWDTALLTFLLQIHAFCEENGIEMSPRGLPPGAERLFRLATSVPEKEQAEQNGVRGNPLARAGEMVADVSGAAVDTLDFIGQVTRGGFRMLTGKARFRRSDVLQITRQCGADALPIVTLIGFLMGLILAFVGAVQLRTFGAEIYVADLVGIGIVRELGAIMAGVVMAGRTGAAFAATLGTMQVNEEIDAFTTLGISPVEFLVLPRMLALTLMMPLLCVYADLLGLLGGMFVAVTMLDLNPVLYWHQTCAAVGTNDFWVGIVMSVVFGVLVSFSGCFRGIRCGRSSSAVGRATTSAVVTSIVSIVVATAVITVICDMIGV